MKSIKLENIRCLSDTGFIEIKPLTIILGENSSGKSTFVRTFPLLRQSVTENPKGPILFYGNYVDFGELKNLMTKGSKKNEITFSFKFEETISSLFNYASKTEDAFEIEIRVSIKDHGNNIPYTATYEISFHNYKAKFEFDNEKITNVTVNGENFGKYYSEIRSTDDGRFFPSLYEKIPVEHAPLGYIFRSLITQQQHWSNLSLPAKLELELLSTIKNQHKTGTSNETINTLTHVLSYESIRYGNITKRMSKINSATQTWKKNAVEMERNKKKRDEFFRIEKIIAISSATIISEKLNAITKDIFSNIKYIAPVRATAERYYRKRNIAVSEVDFRGENLPMYIASLTNSKLEKLTTWLEQNFSLKLLLGKETGHLSLEIQHLGSDQVFNMADMGFGFSQVMPILVQLWSIIEQGYRSRRRVAAPIIYVMEQPELHLHPRLQALLSTVLCKAIFEANSKNIDLRIIIETHSESIIGKVGSNIASKIISENDTNLIIFNKLPNENISTTSIAKFNKNGQLENWPWGFFD